MALLDATPAVQETEETLGLSVGEFAQALKVHPRTVARWLDGDMPQRNHGRERLEQLAALSDTLLALFGSSKAVQHWLGAENRYLGMLTPREALLVGRIDRVSAAAEALASGVFV